MVCLLIIIAVTIGGLIGKFIAGQPLSTQGITLGVMGIVIIFIGIFIAYIGFTERI